MLIGGIHAKRVLEGDRAGEYSEKYELEVSPVLVVSRSDSEPYRISLLRRSYSDVRATTMLNLIN